jgi:hypothetical protein
LGQPNTFLADSATERVFFEPSSQTVLYHERTGAFACLNGLAQDPTTGAWRFEGTYVYPSPRPRPEFEMENFDMFERLEAYIAFGGDVDPVALAAAAAGEAADARAGAGGSHGDAGVAASADGDASRVAADKSAGVPAGPDVLDNPGVAALKRARLKRETARAAAAGAGLDTAGGAHTEARPDTEEEAPKKKRQVGDWAAKAQAEVVASSPDGDGDAGGEDVEGEEEKPAAPEPKPGSAFTLVMKNLRKGAPDAWKARGGPH